MPSDDSFLAGQHLNAWTASLFFCGTERALEFFDKGANEVPEKRTAIQSR